VRQTITAPLAGALQSGFAGGGGLFGLFHEGGVAGERSAPWPARASQDQIAADMARAIDRASRNR
jgi:hypothetical protein